MVDQSHFSANIRLDLKVCGRLIPLVKVGPNYAVPQVPQDIPSGTAAVLIMTVDGREHCWEITLRNGAVPFDEAIEYHIDRHPDTVLR